MCGYSREVGVARPGRHVRQRLNQRTESHIGADRHTGPPSLAIKCTSYKLYIETCYLIQHNNVVPLHT